MCFNRNPCCLCINGQLPRNVSKSRVLHENQLDLLFDRSGRKLPVHNSKSWSIFCCLPAKQTATIEQLDVTLIRCLLINFSSNCTPGSLMRSAVDDLIGYRNKLYGHVEVARISDIDYNLNKPQIECRILDIAKFCKIENEMKQKLHDAYIRPLDQALCCQYQNILLDEIRRTEKLETEIKSLLTSTECRIREHIDTINLDISNKLENISLHFKHQDTKLQSTEDNLKSEIHEERNSFEITMNEHRICLHDTNTNVGKVHFYCEQLGAKLQSTESNLKTEVLEQQSKFEITMHEHRQILEDTKKTVYENIWKTESTITGEIQETPASLENKIDEYQKQTEQQMQNLKHTMDLTMSDPRIKHRTSDYRKDNLTAHTHARLEYHTNDKTFVQTRAVTFAKEILEKQKILILLAKTGSGKSTISLHLASTYKDKGYVPLLFIDKDIIQYRDLVSVNEKSLVVVEDLFGRSNVQFEEDIHKNILDVLLSLMNSPNLRLIITIRNTATCAAQILEKHDIFKEECIMNLDSDWTLSDEEKINIFLRHMEHNSITKCAHPLQTDFSIDYDQFPSCLSCTKEVLELPGGNIQVCTDFIYLVCSFDTYIGFPETCRMFCSNKRFTHLGVEYFRRTTHSLLNTLNELFTNGFDNIKFRYQYCLLVYTAMHNGFLMLSKIEKNFQNDNLIVSLFSIFDDVNIKIRRPLVFGALKELEGTFLIKTSQLNDFEWSHLLEEDGYFFKHQSIFEAVLISFGTECPNELLDLEICGIDFIFCYIRPSYSCHEVETPILFVDSEDLLAKLFNILKHERQRKCAFIGVSSDDSEVIYQRTEAGKEIKDENLVRSKDDVLNKSSTGKELLRNVDDNPNSDKKTSPFTIPKDNYFNRSDMIEEDLSNISDENNEADDEIWIIKDDNILNRNRFCCKEAEKVGMFIRTCIVEGHYQVFVSNFFERLPITSLDPSQITDILNGLTRHGKCALNLKLKIDKLKEYIWDYGTLKMLCLLLRPQSSNTMSHVYYQINSNDLSEKFVGFINESSEYEPIAEIGKYLSIISAEECNETFINNLLNAVVVRFSANDKEKIMYLIDGIWDKGKCDETLSHFRDFLNSNLLKYGSINAILNLCSLHSGEDRKVCSIVITREDFLKILGTKFHDFLMCQAGHKNGVSLKTQAQELGCSVYEFGMKQNQCDFIEELISTIVTFYDQVYLSFGIHVFFQYNVKFLFYFADGFTQCGKRLNIAKAKYPRSMELLVTHCNRYKIYERRVRKQVKKDQSGSIWDKSNIIYHLMHVSKLKLDESDDNNESDENAIDE